MLLAAEGASIFFDEWSIPLGAPLVGGIQTGIAESDVFILIWSAAAQSSNWVGAEAQAFVRRRMDQQHLRIIPLMIDETPLPAMVADYRGLNLAPGTPQGNTLETVIQVLFGEHRDVEIAQRLQLRLLQLARDNTDARDHFDWIVCPACASANLKRSSAQMEDDIYYMIECQDCGRGDWTQ